MHFFVRAASDSEHGTPEFREWQRTEKEMDRKIKGIYFPFNLGTSHGVSFPTSVRQPTIP